VRGSSVVRKASRPASGVAVARRTIKRSNAAARSLSRRMPISPSPKGSIGRDRYKITVAAYIKISEINIATDTAIQNFSRTGRLVIGTLAQPNTTPTKTAELTRRHGFRSQRLNCLMGGIPMLGGIGFVRHLATRRTHYQGSPLSLGAYLSGIRWKAWATLGRRFQDVEPTVRTCIVAGLIAALIPHLPGGHRSLESRSIGHFRNFSLLTVLFSKVGLRHLPNLAHRRAKCCDQQDPFAPSLLGEPHWVRAGFVVGSFLPPQATESTAIMCRRWVRLVFFSRKF
jgi:hypothetical protein